jgi:hypothetical protein
MAFRNSDLRPEQALLGDNFKALRSRELGRRLWKVLAMHLREVFAVGSYYRMLSDFAQAPHIYYTLTWSCLVKISLFGLDALLRLVTREYLHFLTCVELLREVCSDAIIQGAKWHQDLRWPLCT